VSSSDPAFTAGARRRGTDRSPCPFPPIARSDVGLVALEELLVDEQRDDRTDDRTDDAGSADLEFTTEDQGTEETADERTDDAQDDGAEPAEVFLAGHDEAGDGTGDEADDEEPKKRQHESVLLDVSCDVVRRRSVAGPLASGFGES